MTAIPLARLSAWSLLATIGFFTLGPAHSRPHLTQDPQIERALAYGLLGYVFALAYPRARIAVGLGVLIGAIGLEAAQMLTLDRHPHVRDAVAKGLGGVAGVAAVVLAQVVQERSRPQ